MIYPASTWDHLRRLLAAIWEPHGLRLPDSIPWSEAAALAETHSLGPLLYVALQSVETVPNDVRGALRRSYYRAAAANIHYVQDLAHILAALSTVETPILLLKGQALAETLYRNAALRPINDLDLVVPAQGVPACRQVLTKLGYAPTEVDLAPGAHLAYRNEWAFTHRELAHIMVEIHWHLIDVPYYLRKVPMEWFWEHTEIVELAGQSVRVLNPEANLVYLPAHLALHHRFHGLHWFVDLALLVHKHRDTLDWDKVITAAQSFDLLLVLRETLDRLAAYWPSLPLDAPRSRLQAMQPTPFEGRIFRLLTAEPRSSLLDFYTDLVCLPGVSARLRFFVFNMFPQRAYMVKRYGVQRSWTLPYWYLYRLGDGAIKMARILPQALRRDLSRLDDAPRADTATL